MKLISTLHVYLNSDETEESSSYHSISDHEGELIINLKGDEGFGSELGFDIPSNYETIIAHEIGHYVAAVTNDIVMSREFRLVFGHLPSELKAWKIADEMKLNLNKKMEEKTIKLDKKFY